MQTKNHHKKYKYKFKYKHEYKAKHKYKHRQKLELWGTSLTINHNWKKDVHEMYLLGPKITNFIYIYDIHKCGCQFTAFCTFHLMNK